VPHIVLDKSLNLFDFSILFKPIFQKSPLIKIQDMYVDTRGTNALLSVVVIDDSHHEFFIQLISNKDKTTIRLYPLTDPVKTDAVKQSLANLCLEIQKCYPDIKIIRSNLWDYLVKDIVQ
jgi:hypothetical protein|tara:strand:+ start:652 stop:1011 length:360 start_codon:yes stop_codon:yes gene_type:complete